MNSGSNHGSSGVMRDLSHLDAFLHGFAKPAKLEQDSHQSSLAGIKDLSAKILLQTECAIQQVG